MQISAICTTRIRPGLSNPVGSALVCVQLVATRISAMVTPIGSPSAATQPCTTLVVKLTVDDANAVHQIRLPGRSDVKSEYVQESTWCIRRTHLVLVA